MLEIENEYQGAEGTEASKKKRSASGTVWYITDHMPGYLFSSDLEPIFFLLSLELEYLFTLQTM